MIVDLELVSRVERAIASERRAFALGSPRERPQGAVLEVGRGLAVFTGAEMFSNRVFGMGVGSAVEPGDLDRIEDFYRERGAPAVSSPPDGGVEVRIVDDTNAGECSDVLIEGFGYDDPTDQTAIIRWNNGLLETDGVHAFVGRLGGAAVGSASVYIDGDIAVLGGAATVSLWRRRGVQSALIAARLGLASTSGCELAVVTADPGSTSGRNAERAGFELVCTHSVFAADQA